MNTLADRTHCNNMHEFTPENTGFRKDGGRVCKTCNRERRQRQLATPEAREAKRVLDRENKRRKRATMMGRVASRTANAEYQRRRYARLHGKTYPVLPVTTVEDSLTKKNPLDYLKLNDDQAKKSDGVNFAIDKARSRPPCESDPDRWQFDVDAPPSSWPTSQEAQDMCAGCPFLQECFAYGESLKSKDNCGIWGGVRFVYGRKLN